MQLNMTSIRKCAMVVASFVVFYAQGNIAFATNDALEDLNVGAAAVLETSITIEQSELEELVVRKENELEKENKVNQLVMANVNNLVNVRSEASADAEMVGVLYQDCGGTILESVEGWTKIQSGSVIGWVNNDYLIFGEEAVEEAKELGRYVAVVDAEALRVRKDTSEEAGIYGLVAKGERVDVISETEDWIGIDYEGNIGYLSAGYIEVEFEVDHGETLEEIEERKRQEEEFKASMKRQNDAIKANTSDLELLAALIYCEAGGEPYEGKVAVGAVVMNRVRSAAYPNTIYDVIFASGQFTPAMNGKVAARIAAGSPPSCYQAAQEALNGVSNVGDLTHFRVAGGINGYIIGNHVFH